MDGSGAPREKGRQATCKLDHDHPPPHNGAPTRLSTFSRPLHKGTGGPERPSSQLTLADHGLIYQTDRNNQAPLIAGQEQLGKETVSGGRRGGEGRETVRDQSMLGRRRKNREEKNLCRVLPATKEQDKRCQKPLSLGKSESAKQPQTPRNPLGQNNRGQCSLQHSEKVCPL